MSSIQTNETSYHIRPKAANSGQRMRNTEINKLSYEQVASERERERELRQATSSRSTFSDEEAETATVRQIQVAPEAANRCQQPRTDASNCEELRAVTPIKNSYTDIRKPRPARSQNLPIVIHQTDHQQPRAARIQSLQLDISPRTDRHKDRFHSPPADAGSME